MQNDYVFGTLGSERAREVLPLIAKRVSDFHNGEGTVFFTRDTRKESEVLRDCCRAGSDGWQIVSGLWNGSDPVIDKPAPGSVRLAAVIGKMRPESIEIVGTPAETSVLSNAVLLNSALPDACVCVNSALVAGMTAQKESCAVEAMRNCGITVVG